MILKYAIVSTLRRLTYGNQTKLVQIKFILLLFSLEFFGCGAFFFFSLSLSFTTFLHSTLPNEWPTQFDDSERNTEHVSWVWPIYLISSTFIHCSLDNCYFPDVCRDFPFPILPQRHSFARSRRTISPSIPPIAVSFFASLIFYFGWLFVKISFQLKMSRQKCASACTTGTDVCCDLTLESVP